jgi:hypothetical protein
VIGSACDHACRDVAVAVQVLRRAVPDDVDPEPERLLIHRGREGVVGESKSAVRAREGGHGFQIRDLEQRIARGLEQQEFRARRHGRLERGHVCLIDLRVADAEPR